MNWAIIVIKVINYLIKVPTDSQTLIIENKGIHFIYISIGKCRMLKLKWNIFIFIRLINIK